MIVNNLLVVLSTLYGIGSTADNAFDQATRPNVFPRALPRQWTNAEYQTLTNYFPNLLIEAGRARPAFNIQVVAEASRTYNCLAYALGFTDRDIDPSAYGEEVRWNTVDAQGRPVVASTQYVTAEGIVRLLGEYGYVSCPKEEADIDMYGKWVTREDGKLHFYPTHSARAYGSRNYAVSKIGNMVAISHPRDGL